MYRAVSMFQCRFNPHFRKGSDANLCFFVLRKHCFNPHFRKGSDLLAFPFSTACASFNPHFRKGSDHFRQLLLPQSVVSIHTSAREVTDVEHLGWFSVDVSIHTSAREVTLLNRNGVMDIWFQSTLPQGK